MSEPRGLLDGLVQAGEIAKRLDVSFEEGLRLWREEADAREAEPETNVIQGPWCA